MANGANTPKSGDTLCFFNMLSKIYSYVSWVSNICVDPQTKEHTVRGILTSSNWLSHYPVSTVANVQFDLCCQTTELKLDLSCWWLSGWYCHLTAKRSCGVLSVCLPCDRLATHPWVLPAFCSMHAPAPHDPEYK